MKSRLNHRMLIGLATMIIVVSAGIVGWSATLHRVSLLPGVAGCRFLDDRQQRNECIADRFVERAHESGTKSALVQLEQVAHRNGSIAEMCHDSGHLTAPRLARNYSVRAQLLVAASVRGDCADGFFHGTMIEALAGKDDATIDTLAKLCGSKQMASSQIRASCVHSIGHGVAAGSDLHPALASCRRHYPGTDSLVQQCYSGVFMQYGMDRTAEMRRSGDVSGHCASLNLPDALYQCYSYIPSNGTNLGWSSERIYKSCSSTPDAWARTVCIRGVGNGRLRDGSGFCLGLRSHSDIAACMEGFFIRNVVSYPEFTPTAAARLCSQSSASARTSCAQGLGAAWKSGLWPTPGDRSCRDHLAGALLNACLSGYRAAAKENLRGSTAASAE